MPYPYILKIASRSYAGFLYAVGSSYMRMFKMNKKLHIVNAVNTQEMFDLDFILEVETTFKNLFDLRLRNSGSICNYA